MINAMLHPRVLFIRLLLLAIHSEVITGPQLMFLVETFAAFFSIQGAPQGFHSIIEVYRACLGAEDCHSRQRGYLPEQLNEVYLAPTPAQDRAPKSLAVWQNHPFQHSLKTRVPASLEHLRALARFADQTMPPVCFMATNSWYNPSRIQHSICRTWQTFWICFRHLRPGRHSQVLIDPHRAHRPWTPLRDELLPHLFLRCGDNSFETSHLETGIDIWWQYNLKDFIWRTGLPFGQHQLDIESFCPTWKKKELELATFSRLSLHMWFWFFVMSFHVFYVWFVFTLYSPYWF